MLFIHVVSDIGIFVGIGAWLLGFAALRRAQDVSQVRLIAALIHRTEPLSVASSLLTVVSGLYLLLTAWGWQTAWALVALGSIFVFLPPLLLAVIEPRMRRILRLASESPNGPVPGPLRRLIQDPVLATALQTMAAVMLGIVFLMTTKPSFTGSFLAVVVAVTCGLASGLPRVLTARSATDDYAPGGG
jgi:hypothetical protein